MGHSRRSNRAQSHLALGPFGQAQARNRQTFSRSYRQPHLATIAPHAHSMRHMHLHTTAPHESHLYLGDTELYYGSVTQHHSSSEFAWHQADL